MRLAGASRLETSRHEGLVWERASRKRAAVGNDSEEARLGRTARRPQELSFRSGRGHSPAVDHVLAPMNRRGSLRDEEGDQLGHLFGMSGPADRDPSK